MAPRSSAVSQKRNRKRKGSWDNAQALHNSSVRSFLGTGRELGAANRTERVIKHQIGGASGFGGNVGNANGQGIRGETKENVRVLSLRRTCTKRIHAEGVGSTRPRKNRRFYSRPSKILLEGNQVLRSM